MTNNWLKIVNCQTLVWSSAFSNHRQENFCFESQHHQPYLLTIVNSSHAPTAQNCSLFTIMPMSHALAPTYSSDADSASTFWRLLLYRPVIITSFSSYVHGLIVLSACSSHNWDLGLRAVQNRFLYFDARQFTLSSNLASVLLKQCMSWKQAATCKEDVLLLPVVTCHSRAMSF
jgi:hypothetical protein